MKHPPCVSLRDFTGSHFLLNSNLGWTGSLVELKQRLVETRSRLSAVNPTTWETTRFALKQTKIITRFTMTGVLVQQGWVTTVFNSLELITITYNHDSMEQ